MRFSKNTHITDSTSSTSQQFGAFAEIAGGPLKLKRGHASAFDLLEKCETKRDVLSSQSLFLLYEEVIDPLRSWFVSEV